MSNIPLKNEEGSLRDTEKKDIEISRINPQIIVGKILDDPNAHLLAGISGKIGISIMPYRKILSDDTLRWKYDGWDFSELLWEDKVKLTLQLLKQIGAYLWSDTNMNWNDFARIEIVQERIMIIFWRQIKKVWLPKTKSYDITSLINDNQKW